MKTWKILIYVIVVAISGSGTFAKDPAVPDRAMARPPKLTDDEVKAIRAMSTSDLANLVRTGHSNQKQHAVSTLVARDQGALLLGIAKDGPRATSDVVIEIFVPKAVPKDNAKAKQLVDDYVSFLEGQLKAAKPIVTPRRCTRSLGRVVYWAAAEATPTPRRPRLEPRYGHQKVVGILVALLSDRRTVVSEVAAQWLGSVGGYAAKQSQEVIAALEAHRRAVAAQPVGNRKERERQEMRLAKIDHAIKDVKREQQRQSATRRISPTTRRADVSDK